MSNFNNQKHRGVPFAVDGDAALSGPTTNPLHTKPLPHKGGPQGRDLVSHSSPLDNNVKRYAEMRPQDEEGY